MPVVESSLGSIGEVSGITESSEMDTTYEKEDDTSCEAPTRPQFREQTENTVQEAYPEMQSASESSEEFHASLLLQQHVQQQVASMKNPETSNPSIPTPFLEAMTQLSEYLREVSCLTGKLAEWNAYEEKSAEQTVRDQISHPDCLTDRPQVESRRNIPFINGPVLDAVLAAYEGDGNSN